MNSIMKSAGFVYIYMCVYTNIMVVGELFTLGYLTGSQRRSGNLEYAKPGKNFFLLFLLFVYWDYVSVSRSILTHLHTLTFDACTQFALITLMEFSNYSIEKKKKTSYSNSSI